MLRLPVRERAVWGVLHPREPPELLNAADLTIGGVQRVAFPYGMRELMPYASVKWETSRSSSSAVLASSDAEAAICWVEALVC